MKKVFPFLLFLIASTLNTAYAQSNTWQQTNLQKSFINTVQVSPWGLLAGERDSRIWQNPFNGIYISKNLGNSWIEFGLAGRGITDIDFNEQDVYASTYYFINNTAGIFKSSDGGLNWTHICNNFSTSAVSANKDYVLIGTYSHGLWVYKEGICSQKINTTEIYAAGNDASTAIATAINKTYLSTDSGQNWTEIAFFNGKNIKHVLINKNYIFACSESEKKLYRSQDNGTNWSTLNLQGCGKLIFYKNNIYTALPTQTNVFSVKYSQDFGNTWTDTNWNVQNIDGNISDLTWLYSDPSYIFSVLPSKGVYKYKVDTIEIAKTPFMDIPWDFISPSELVDSITSYFDHKYPLFNAEPASATATTLNYLGIENKPPYMYYSSHDGIDFERPYGSDVKAVADGTATYYYCTDCGNTIKIDHKNGYQSIYLHLQKDGLITTNQPVEVRKGDVIGKVGLTGNTTGPHIHLGINKFENHEAIKTDPFGWQNDTLEDPWPLYNWNDASGNHAGTTSMYLWNSDINKKSELVANTQTELNLDNKTITANLSDSAFNYTLYLRSYSKPLIPKNQYNLRYVPNTSLILEAKDITNTNIFNFSNPLTIKINLNESELRNIISSTLKIYFWNDLTLLWEPLVSVLDPNNKTISADTDHLSHFAVLGESIDFSPPITNILISGQELNGWFIGYPTIILTTESDASTVYSLDKGVTWKNYSEPFIFNTEGVSEIYYKSIDGLNNLEASQQQVIKVDKTGKWKKKIKVEGGSFKLGPMML